MSPEAIRADANMTVHVYARERFRLARRVKAHNITVEQEEAHPFHSTARSVSEKDTLRVTQPQIRRAQQLQRERDNETTITYYLSRSRPRAKAL